jgi:hypothetical protein
MSRGDKILLREERKQYSGARPSSSPPPPPPSSFSSESRSRNQSFGDDFHFHDEVHHHHHPDDHSPHPLPSAVKPSPTGTAAETGTGTGSPEVRSKHSHSRSINSESVELLTLHSDMRCFVMDETPIASFCGALLHTTAASESQSQSQSRDQEEPPPSSKGVEEEAVSNVYIPHQAGRSDIEHGMSYLRQQFIFMHKKSVSYCVFWAVVVIVVSAVRVAIVEFIGVQDETTSVLGLVSIHIYLVYFVNQ